ncbi:MAG: hypothetical protein ACREID_08640, partial [Planctomycetota bacterium]
VCVEEASGRARWSIEEPDPAGKLASLRERLRVLRADGDALRSSPLPLYARAGDAIVCALEGRGVRAVAVADGATRWSDTSPEGSPVGPPCVEGGSIAVGWSKPGRADVYTVEGRRTASLACETVLAPPVLDPRGRLFVVQGPVADPAMGGMKVHDLSAGAHWVLGAGFQAHSRYAAVLYADGKTAVFHDGSSRPPGDPEGNLHFLDMASGGAVHRTAGDLLRDVHLRFDGSRLFVFTCKTGVRGEGARLYRIDPAASECFLYDHPAPADAYAPPLLTLPYVVVGAASARSAVLSAYEREASGAATAPHGAFREGGDVASRLLFGADGTARFHVPPSLGILESGLVFGNPFGAALLTARTPR